MHTLRVLITDDEQGMRMAVSRALRNYRVSIPDIEGEVVFEVQEAATGEEALDIIGESKPHILLLDYKLPGISGLDVLDKITAEPSDMLTIMITAYASLETAVTATKRGAYDFLAKPFTPEELKAVIRKSAGRLLLLRQARDLAEEKRKVRFQFISVLAHELKAPLAAIDGYLQIMQNRTAGDSLDAYDQVIDRTKVRLDGMRKLIMDLLDMTRIESGQRERRFAAVEVAGVAGKAIETVEAEAAERGITVSLHAPDSVMMTADPSEIEIILNNLVTNAVKYNRDGGSVDITIADTPGEVTITVADTGIGMSDEEAAKLFNDFVRIKNEKTRKILGSGLGLSTVKKLAMLYNGDVSVESVPDEGSTFTVVLKKDAVETES